MPPVEWELKWTDSFGTGAWIQSSHPHFNRPPNVVQTIYGSSPAEFSGEWPCGLQFENEGNLLFENVMVAASVYYNWGYIWPMVRWDGSGAFSNAIMLRNGVLYKTVNGVDYELGSPGGYNLGVVGNTVYANGAEVTVSDQTLQGEMYAGYLFGAIWGGKFWNVSLYTAPNISSTSGIMTPNKGVW